MWIGVISDTHGVVHPRTLEIFEGVDFILHCGDIGHPSVLDELSQIAPISGVIGQSDNPEEYPLQRTLFRRWSEVGVYVNHRIGEPQVLRRSVTRDLEVHDPQVVLFGHSPEPFNTRIDDRLFFNPGPAGRRRVKFPRSIGILEVDGQSVRGEIVLLNDR